ncbi:MAG: hypothetical protein IJ347_06855 [Faecalibacterium sp.]|nr:hypothetical protein [Faecalibacterium sp.]
MWIYPNSSPIANATTAETVQKPKETAAKMHFSDEGELRHPTAEHAVKAAQTSPRHAAPVTRKRDTVSIPRYSSLFAMLYALGLSISGVLAAVCSPQETVFLQQYLALTRQHYQNDALPQLFVQLLVQAVLPMMLVYLFSQSALGQVFAAVIVLLYGIHTGLISVLGFVTDGLQGLAFYAISLGLYYAAIAGCLCKISCLGAAVSAQYFRFAAKAQTPETAQQLRRTTKRLNKNFVYMLVLLVMLCVLVTLASILINRLSI